MPVKVSFRILPVGLVCLFLAALSAQVQADDTQGEVSVDASVGPDDAEVSRVLALSEDIAWGEYLAGECSTCHGASPGDGGVPVVHGAEPRMIVRALIEYRTGVRSNTTMQSVAGALSDEEVAVLAHYLSSAVP